MIETIDKNTSYLLINYAQKVANLNQIANYIGLLVQARLRPILHCEVRRLCERDGQHVRPPDQRLHPEARRGVQQHPRRQADSPKLETLS